MNETDKTIDNLTSYQFLGGAMGGWATAFFFVMTNQLSNYELFGLFLISFSLYLLGMWWYPIYMRKPHE